MLKYADQDFTIVEISKELLEKINTKEILINGTFYPLIKFNPFKIPIVSLSLSLRHRSDDASSSSAQ